MTPSSRRALTCVLLAGSAAAASVLAAAPAAAQSAMPPAFRTLDPNGVDLATGQFVFSLQEGVVGSGGNALELVRTGMLSHQWDDIRLRQETVGASLVYTAELGSRWERFTGGSDGAEARGSSLVTVANGLEHRSADGTVIRFTDPAGYGGSTSPFCNGSAGQSSCHYLPAWIRTPDGRQTDIEWELKADCGDQPIESESLCTFDARIASVSNASGYRIAFSYALGGVSGSGGTPPDWFRRTTAAFYNDAAGAAPVGQATYAVPGSGLLDITDMGGRVWRIAGAFRSITAVRRPGAAANTTLVTTGGSGGSVSQIVRDGVTANYARSVSGSSATTVVTNALNQATTIVTDVVHGRPTAITNALGQTTSLAYDSWGRLTRVTAPEGNYIETSHDARGNAVQVQAVAKPGSGTPTITTSATFAASCTSAACNRPLTTTDARGQVTHYDYDPVHGGLLAVTAPAAPNGARPQIRNIYALVDGEHRLTGTSTCQTTGGTPGAAVSPCAGTADEVKTTIGYDANGNVTSSVTANGTGTLSAAQAMTYDAKGDLLTVDGPLPGTADTTRYRYNAGRQRIGTVSPDPDGTGALKHRAVRHGFEAATGRLAKIESGNVASQSDADWAAFAANGAAEHGYDANGRLTTTRLTAGGATHSLTQYSYDAVGRAECSALRMNPAAYAALPASACGLGTQGSHGPDRIAKRTWDAAGRQTRLESGYGTAAQGDEWLATYTPNGAVATVADGELNRTTYDYDGHDRPVKTRFPLPVKGAGMSSTSDYEGLAYDNGGNITQRRLRDGQLVALSYDNLGRLAAKDLPGSEPDVSYGYDLLGRMLTATQAGSSLSFGWDALGRNTSQSGPMGTTGYGYDAAGRRTQINYGAGLVIDYDHLVTGEVTRIRENGATSGVGVLAAYAYDDLGRRTGLVRGNGTAKSYAYDAASRLAAMGEDLAGTAHDLALGFTYNPASQIATATRSNDAYAWTNHYNLSRSYTANGLNQYTASGPVTPTYDGRGNLTSAGGATYGYNSENMLVSASGGIALAYDPLLRLQQTSGGSGGTTRFAYDGQDLIAEYNGSGAVLRRYVHGPGSDEPLVWYEGAGTADRRWLHADERGSIVAVTNASGTVTAANRYDEYGIPSSANTGRFQYTGQTWLSELGLYHYKARIYSPTLGRFLQADPIGYGDGMNMYAYVGGDPVNLRDPSGMCSLVNVGYSWFDPRTGERLGPAPGNYYVLRNCTSVGDLGGGSGSSNPGGGSGNGIPDDLDCTIGKVSISKRGDNVTMTGNIDFKPQPGDPPIPPNYPNAALSAINSQWSGPHGRYQVTTNMSVGTGGVPGFVGSKRTGEFAGSVNFPSLPPDFGSHPGFDGDWARVTAHEFGHYLGLSSEAFLVTNAAGQSAPVWPHTDGGIMGNNAPPGPKLEEHIAEILRNCKKGD